MTLVHLPNASKYSLANHNKKALPLRTPYTWFTETSSTKRFPTHTRPPQQNPHRQLLAQFLTRSTRPRMRVAKRTVLLVSDRSKQTTRDNGFPNTWLVRGGGGGEALCNFFARIHSHGLLPPYTLLFEVLFWSISFVLDRSEPNAIRSINYRALGVYLPILLGRHLLLTHIGIWFGWWLEAASQRFVLACSKATNSKTEQIPSDCGMGK